MTISCIVKFLYANFTFFRSHQNTQLSTIYIVGVCDVGDKGCRWSYDGILKENQCNWNCDLGAEDSCQRSCDWVRVRR